jgi:PucR C-terminal helix-turn-helix domain/GGDEF-like domain
MGIEARISTEALMTAVADRMETDIDAAVTEMVTEILAAEPILRDDPALVTEVQASCLANIRRYLIVARRAADQPPADAPLEALDVARTFVRRGIETDVMYQAYRRGQQVLWRRWMATAETIATGSELAEVLNPSLELLFTYVDAVLGHAIAEMQRERERVLGGALARRVETIRLLLDGAPIDATIASERLGVDLRRHHTSLVLWTETDAPPAALETATVAVARAAGLRQPLTLAAGTSVLWAWLTSDGPVALAPTAVPADVRIAMGPTRRGPGGVRSSHEAALSIHRLMAGNPEAGQVASYDELEVTALAAQDEARAREFVQNTLGPLAEDTPTATRLRDTLRVFLEEAEHGPRTAARQHTHRNTVLQRVARATELLGYQPGERRLAVTLALELRRRLGPSAH